MAVKVKTPNANYEGEVAGVKFYHGEATFEDEALGKHIAESLGYAVEQIVEVVEDAEPKKSAKVRKEAKE